MHRKLLRKVVLILIILGTVLAPLTLKPLVHGFGGSKEVITAQGMVDNKRSIDYECGTSKNRSTCTDYMLSVNGKEHIVSSSTFHSYTEDQHITLVKTENSRSACWWEVILIVFSSLSLVISGTWLIFNTVFFLYWCLVSDTRLSFKEWMS
jgi:hypothetical protein